MKTIGELTSLRGRTALVTGGAGHIGMAICEALAEIGACVAVLDIDSKTCENRANQLSEKYKIDTLSLNIDVTDENALKEIPNRVYSHFGRLDILVNNAALVGTTKLEGWAVPFEQQSVDTWRKAMEVNVTAPFVLSQLCADMLSKNKVGSIINISSIYGMIGPVMSIYDETSMGLPAAYSTSKGGLIQLTRWLATVLAPNIRANSITLGGVWRNQPELFCRRYIERTPMQRMAIEEDIKGAAVYLASDLSAYVTGQNIVVDGGWTAW